MFYYECTTCGGSQQTYCQTCHGRSEKKAKCQHCDRTGQRLYPVREYFIVACMFCNGEGTVTKFDVDHSYQGDCDFCQGSGQATDSRDTGERRYDTCDYCHGTRKYCLVCLNTNKVTCPNKCNTYGMSWKLPLFPSPSARPWSNWATPRSCAKCT